MWRLWPTLANAVLARPFLASPFGGLWRRRGFTRQHENSKRAHLRVPALQTPPKFHEKTPREREREKKSEDGGRRGKKKSAKFWAPAFGHPPFEPTLRFPTLRAHIPPGSTLRPPSLRAEALQASTFSGFGPLRSSFLPCCSFVLFLCIFNCFYFLASLSLPLLKKKNDTQGTTKQVFKTKKKKNIKKKKVRQRGKRREGGRKWRGSCFHFEALSKMFGENKSGKICTPLLLSLLVDNAMFRHF